MRQGLADSAGSSAGPLTYDERCGFYDARSNRPAAAFVRDEIGRAVGMMLGTFAAGSSCHIAQIDARSLHTGVTGLLVEARADVRSRELLQEDEDLQPVRSYNYKLPGAYNFIASLSDSERAKGVVCASAGNHGQGVAYRCRRLGVECRVVLSRTTPRQKREQIAALGGPGGDDRRRRPNLRRRPRRRLPAGRRRGRSPRPALRRAAGDRGPGHGRPRGGRASSGTRPTCSWYPWVGEGFWPGQLSPWRTSCPGPKSSAWSRRGRPACGPHWRWGSLTLASVDSFVDGAAVRRVGSYTFDLVRECHSVNRFRS